MTGGKVAEPSRHSPSFLERPARAAIGRCEPEAGSQLGNPTTGSDMKKNAADPEENISYFSLRRTFKDPSLRPARPFGWFFRKRDPSKLPPALSRFSSQAAQAGASYPKASGNSLQTVKQRFRSDGEELGRETWRAIEVFEGLSCETPSKLVYPTPAAASCSGGAG